MARREELCIYYSCDLCEKETKLDENCNVPVGWQIVKWQNKNGFKTSFVCNNCYSKITKLKIISQLIPQE